MVSMVEATAPKGIRQRVANMPVAGTTEKIPETLEEKYKVLGAYDLLARYESYEGRSATVAQRRTGGGGAAASGKPQVFWSVRLVRVPNPGASGDMKSDPSLADKVVQATMPGNKAPNNMVAFRKKAPPANTSGKPFDWRKGGFAP